MRKLILKMSISLDGFVGGPNGEIDWLLKTEDDESNNWTKELIWQAGVHIMGSHTFQDMISYWPTSPDPLAAAMNDLPKIVFSRKGLIQDSDKSMTTQALKDAISADTEKGITRSSLTKNASGWDNAQVARGDLNEEISKLKQQPGKPILAHGGASFARSLVQSGLIDEYQLLVHPVTLGVGLPLFSALKEPLYLKLKSSVAFKGGCIGNIYVP